MLIAKSYFGVGVVGLGDGVLVGAFCGAGAVFTGCDFIFCSTEVPVERREA